MERIKDLRRIIVANSFQRFSEKMDFGSIAEKA
jgi:hypothetical protein